MKKGDDWAKLSKCLSYWELCYIEQALESFSPPFLTDYDKQKVQDLKETVLAARGWSHYLSKMERHT